MSTVPGTPVDRDNSVKVAVRIRPLNDDELVQDSGLFINPVPGQAQINAGPDTYFTFDYVFGPDSRQSDIYDGCVSDLVNATFEGFNSTILAYGQTGSGKTWTMGSSSEFKTTFETVGIIPRVIRKLFAMIRQKETDAPNCSYKVHVQFLEIYGEDMRDLLDQTRTSKVSIRESPEGEVFVSGAKEEQVSSYEQMMKTLEDGSRYRTTASTKMNQSSSRSHAIFTVLLETTIRNGAVVMDGSTASEKSELSSIDNSDNQEEALIKHVTYTSQEVRKCKFHFVDLAGSERAKRTGAIGVQLKEGIDINKGLLALGNVISALGDDTKKGKVFVPYRDSKLTRMLQDSLGGNSKTLMICCVSPAYVNFSESVNALRYANRARNIKNKPVVNRDPQLVIIDELKSLLKLISTELLEIRYRKQYIEFDGGVSNTVLENLSSATTSIADANFSSALTSGNTSAANNSRKSNNDSVQLRKAHDEVLLLKNRLSDSDFEIRRLTDQLKAARQAASDSNELVLFSKSERDFYKMKWSEVCPQDALNLEAMGEIPSGDDDATVEKKNVMNVISEHLREIDSLKKQLALERSANANNADGVPDPLGSPTQRRNSAAKESMFDEEFTSSIASLISQTREQLRAEQLRLKGFEGTLTSAEEDPDSDKNKLESDAAMDTAVNDMDEERAFIRRQKILSNEVAELGQSIQLKEQLVSQLTRGQHQYVAMKAFYEQKLTTLSSEMQEKQAARDKLEHELQNISEEKNEIVHLRHDREKKLREDLKAKDEELKLLKKKQDELNQLSQAQSKYMLQQAKLESDITVMKKQRVDLTKTLQTEKKLHMQDLGNKAKEIEKLKRELYKSAGEIKKLGRDKELAENKARDAMREGAAFKKRTQELMKTSVVVDPAVANARAAVRAMSKVSRLGVNRAKRILNEDELRTKKWLDKRIAEISAREAAADSLKKQYEHQLELLSKRENLENQKHMALLKSRSEGGDAASFVLSADEEENLVEIEDQLHKINSLISQKTQQIDDIQQQIDNAGDVAEIDKTIEALKKSAAGSLPASHELIRLLFDMLVNSSKTIQEKMTVIDEQKTAEKQLEELLEERREAIESEKRMHDMELTRAANEYEQHLSNLFNNMVTLSPTLLSTNHPTSPFRDGQSSLDPTKLQLAISTEESKFLRSQLQRQSLKSSQFQSKLIDLEKLKSRLEKDIDEKNIQIRFLEEERSLFKDLADDLKQGLASMGKPGKVIVDSVKELAANRRKSGVGLFSEYVNNDFDDNGSDTLDSESILGEFEFLADEINRTGGIQVYSSNRGGYNVGLNDSFNGVASHTKPVVYDRLTNPSNFTGHMKNVFNKDIEEKRKKIKEIRYHERSSVVQKPAMHQSANVGSSGIVTPTPTGRESYPKGNGENGSHRRELSGNSNHGKFTFEGQADVSLGGSGLLANGDENHMTTVQEEVPQNVFSRLSTTYTGIHKHRKDDLHVSITALPAPTAAANALRSHSPLMRSAVPTPRRYAHPVTSADVVYEESGEQDRSFSVMSDHSVEAMGTP